MRLNESQLPFGTVFLLINAPGRDAKHSEGASILTLKQQNNVTKKTPFFLKIC